MNKRKISVIVSLVVIISTVAAFIPSLIKNNDNKTNDNKEYQRLLNNTFYESALDTPSNTHQIGDYIAMSTLYAGIKSRLDAVSSGTEAQKEAADLNIVTWIDSQVGSKTVSISDAMELYQFGNAQSINFESVGGTNTYIFRNTIKKVLSLNYALLDDIEYSTMKAQKFVPIGTHILIEESEGMAAVDEKFQFTGTFEGNGFEIRNLYLADAPYITTTFIDLNESAAITIATVKHYSMFSVIGSKGTVKNFVLRNPSYELIVVDDSSGILQFSYLAGENNGTIYNVGVIDKKVNSQGGDTTGIGFTMLNPSSRMATASAFVHINNGTIKNSYFAGNNIVTISSAFRFSNIAPFVYANNGTISGAAFENTAVVKPSGFNPGSITSYSEMVLKEGPTNVNSASTSDTRRWHFYPDDGYPSLIGLDYDNNEYQINNDFDFIAFSKLVTFESKENGKHFYEHTYVLNKDINMTNFKNFKTISKDFKGILKGGNIGFVLGGTENNNRYIYNLRLHNPYIVGNRYYLGIFSVVSGTIKNINLYNNQLNITSSSNDYGKTFYIGSIAGEIRNATIKNIINEGTVNLGTEPLGTTYAGSIVGYGSGLLSFVVNSGSVNGNTHNFNNKAISASYYVGGLMGSNNGNIRIEYSLNQGNVTGVGSTNDQYVVTEAVKTYTGGIIGEVNNITQTTGRLLYVTNMGDVNANKFYGKALKAYQYVGGIFGSVKGYGFKLNNGTTLLNGSLENLGLIKGEYVNQDTFLYAAGIGVANTTETLAKFSYMANHGSFSIKDFNYQTHNKNVYYASTIIDNSLTGIELSRAYNYTSYNFDTAYFTSISGLTNPTVIKIAPFFTSVNDVESSLLYVENGGALTVGNITDIVDVNVLMKISNITQATKINYKNVTNSGDIKVLKIRNNNDSVYVAGITWVLPYINKAYTMTDVVNDGNIYTAGFLGNTIINTHAGTNYSEANYSGTYSQVRNLYVAGIVNLNVGEIRNVFNFGDIKSSYSTIINGETFNVDHIVGTANSYVGGIVTFNYNLIQDAGNSGNIVFINSNTGSHSYYAGVVNNAASASELGGITINYEGGLTLGGISAAFGTIEATVLDGYKVGFITSTGSPAYVPLQYAQIMDTINSGDIFGKSKEFVRSGGILGLALSAELAAGTYESKNTSTTAGPFGRGILGSSDPIGNSLLSNGLNYGNIYAITSSIGSLAGNIGTGGDRGDANYVRPGINATAGGVVAYGLTKMIRMINHGTIASTDVAGGIIGATYILGGTTTTININTAVHYGKIKVAKYLNYGSINYNENETFAPGTSYYEDENEVMFPKYTFSGNNLAYYPNEKRGFGGFIGRLQRGRNGVMYSTNFTNIMNMDPHADLIGRTDMNSVSVSRSYYRLHSSGTSTSYYSARPNDTTGYVVVGWYYSRSSLYIFNHANVTFTVNRSGTGGSAVYYVTKVELSSDTPYSVVEDTNLTKSAIGQSGTSSTTLTLTINRKLYVSGTFYTGSYTSTAYRIANFGLSTGTGAGQINTNGTFPQTITRNDYTYTMQTRFTAITSGNSTTPPTADSLKYSVECIVDDKSNFNGIYIFDPSFPLMSSDNSKFIYAVNEDALATNFKATGSNPKPNGMYVLASTTGSIDGATLPTNIKINNLLKLDESSLKYIDLNNVSINDKLLEGTYYDKVDETYTNMYQLSYNNKADVLAENDEAATKIAELVLYDPRENGKSPILSKGVVNYTTKTITFTVSDSAFAGNSIYYEVKSNRLSNNAVIAKSGITLVELEAFRSDYNKREDNVLKDTSPFKFAYSGSISSGQTINFTMKVYSEISIMDENIFEQGKYIETYTISIVRSGTSIATNATITLDTGSPTTVNSIAANYTVSSTSTIVPNGKITVSFTGTSTAINNLIPVGHLMKVHDVYLVVGTNETKIDSQYYTVTINPKTGNNFGFIVQFDDLLQSGNYKIYYSYYDNSALRSITVTKKQSTSYDVIDVSYNHFSSDPQGLIDTFTRTNSTSITTYTELAYKISGVNTTDTGLLITTVVFDSDKSYISNKYYDLYLGSTKILTVRFAPFATLTGATIRYTYESGKIKYILTYTVRNESNTSTTITHNILERNLTAMYVYLDDNIQASNSFKITREADLSKIGIDFNFSDNNLYANITLTVKIGTTVYNYTPSEIYEGEYDNMYIFYITGALEKGKKDYYFSLLREQGVYYELGTLQIEKSSGTSAYLHDIKFTLSDNEVLFEYPIIRVLNQDGSINTTYDPRVFASGIDYSNTIVDNIKRFRIYGKVSDIILDDYSPRFYLPYGAKIERFDTNSNNWVSYLKDDFAGGEDSVEKVVKYRVTSEDGENIVEYYISVEDIKYNLTLKFKIYYELPNGTLVDASDGSSPIKNKFILISLKNLKLDSIYVTTGPTVNDFPQGIDESKILGINNQSSLYYYTNNDQNIVYRFGRNSTGAYNFNIITPIYTGASTGNLTPGERYNYEMYIMPNSEPNWKVADYKLPYMNTIAEDFSGLYYFVSSPNPNPLTRTLAIVIKPYTADKKWGLYDEYASWD
jgi:hypothetical protein